MLGTWTLWVGNCETGIDLQLDFACCWTAGVMFSNGLGDGWKPQGPLEACSEQGRLKPSESEGKLEEPERLDSQAPVVSYA